MSKKFYTPLDNISTIIGINSENAVNETKTKRNKKSADKAADLGLLRHTETDSGLDKEYDNIINGIKNLIGENNGYKERMISIKPYARLKKIQSNQSLIVCLKMIIKYLRRSTM